MADNIELIRGDSRTINVTVKQSDGTAYDITGGTVFFTVSASKEPTDDTAALIEKDVTSHTDATAGLSAIVLTGTDTDATPGKHYYDIQVKDSAGNILSTDAGRCTIKADITRRTT